MGFRPDLRKTWREQGRLAQQENAERLLGSETVEGGGFDPDKTPHADRPKGRARRLRFEGVRFSLSDVAHKAGFVSGDMYKDLTKASNLKVTRTGFRIRPSDEVLLRTRAFVAGARTRQVARPFSGLSADRVALASEAAALEYREQMVAHMQAELARG